MLNNQLKEYTIFTGALPGKTSVIIAGIHGNEMCGIKAFEKILPSLSIDCGKVIFLIGNPVALSENKRLI